VVNINEYEYRNTLNNLSNVPLDFENEYKNGATENQIKNEKRFPGIASPVKKPEKIGIK
jgi:hypothetical protein